MTACRSVASETNRGRWSSAGGGRASPFDTELAPGTWFPVGRWPVERALAQLQMPPETCLFVGDSHHDIHSGRSAGVWTAGVTWGPFNRDYLEMVAPDYYCDTPDELVEIVSAVAPA